MRPPDDRKTAMGVELGDHRGAPPVIEEDTAAMISRRRAEILLIEDEIWELERGNWDAVERVRGRTRRRRRG